MSTIRPFSSPLPSETAASSAVEEFGQSIGYLLGAISNILSTGGSRFYRQHFGIRLSEWRLRWVLGIEPAITAHRASQIMSLDKAAVSRAVAGLERRGLLHATLDPADNRQRLIGLSPAGNDVYRRIIVVAGERQGRLLAPLSEQHVLAAPLPPTCTRRERRCVRSAIGADEMRPGRGVHAPDFRELAAAEAKATWHGVDFVFRREPLAGMAVIDASFPFPLAPAQVG